MAVMLERMRKGRKSNLLSPKQAQNNNVAVVKC